MKIKSIKSLNTVDPERHWTAGEIVEIEVKVAKKLLTNPNFREIKTQEKVYRRSKIRRIRK